jgi:tetratricopeptide (TPR) repeat protein
MMGGMRLSVPTLVLLVAVAPGLAGAADEAGDAGAAEGAPSRDASLAPALASTTGPAAPPVEPPARPPVVPTQALVERIGKGDRLFLSGEHRNALFAYQDAVYMQPGYAPAHVRLGRAYLALRYPAQAIAQAEAALAADPASAEARELLEKARAAAAGEPGAELAPAASGPRVFRLAPQESAAPPREPASSSGPSQPR